MVYFFLDFDLAKTVGCVVGLGSGAGVNGKGAVSNFFLIFMSASAQKTNEPECLRFTRRSTQISPPMSLQFSQNVQSSE
jgi:hypothetical protein